MNEYVFEINLNNPFNKKYREIEKKKKIQWRLKIK